MRYKYKFCVAYKKKELYGENKKKKKMYFLFNSMFI